MIELSRLQFLKTTFAAAALAILPDAVARAIIPRDFVDTLTGDTVETTLEDGARFAPLRMVLALERVESLPPPDDFHPSQIGFVCPLPADCAMNTASFVVANGRDWLLVRAEEVQTPNGPRFVRRWLLSKAGGWGEPYRH